MVKGASGRGRERWEEEDAGETEGDTAGGRDIAVARQYLSSRSGSAMESEDGGGAI